MVLEPIAGRRLDTLTAGELRDALRRLGAALAALHALAPAPPSAVHPPGARAARHGRRRDRPRAPGRRRAGGARARRAARAPGPRGTARRLPARRRQPAQRASSTATASRLVDLEDAAAGPAAADLGQVLAGLLAARVRGEIDETTERALGDALLAGYAGPRRPPRDALRWHTAASVLARVALPAVNRVRPDLLRPPAAAAEGRGGAAGMRPALLFYCQHSVGLGHLMRSYALCAELAERFRVVLVCGGPLPDGIAPPRGVELVALPALGVGPAGASSATTGASTSRRPGRERRRAHPRHAASVRPAVVLVELFPFGRAKFAREIVPLLEARARGAARCAPAACATSSSRGRRNQRRHDERACAARQRPPRRDPRPLRRPLRAPRGDVRAAPAARRAGALHGLRRRPAAPGPRGARAASWSRPGAAWSASRCCARRPTPSRTLSAAPGCRCG